MTKKEKQEFYFVLFFTIIFMIAGFVMIHFGTKIHNKISRIRKYGIKTVGTIIRYERIKDPKDYHYMILPIVKFHTNIGKEIIIQGKVDNTKILQNLCKTGQEVEIIYNPDNPKEAFINTFAEIWFAPLMLWIIGFFAIVIPPFTLWKGYRKKVLFKYF